MSDSFLTPWTVARQAPLSMGFPRQEYWNGLPFPSPGESSWPRDQIHVSCIGRQVLYPWITREAWNISHSQTKLNIQTIRRAEKELEPVTQIPAEKEKHSLSPLLSLPFSLISLSLCYSKSHFSWILCLKICSLVKFICNPDRICSILIVKVVKIWVMRSQLRSN